MKRQILEPKIKHNISVRNCINVRNWYQINYRVRNQVWKQIAWEVATQVPLGALDQLAEELDEEFSNDI